MEIPAMHSLLEGFVKDQPHFLSVRDFFGISVLDGLESTTRSLPLRKLLHVSLGRRIHRTIRRSLVTISSRLKSFEKD